MTPEFLEPDAVLFLHDQALKEFGGLPGLKDPNLFHSALARPSNKHAYADPNDVDMFDLAAAYAFGFASNHAFNDGNKRTAWSSCILFLTLNGVRLTVVRKDAVDRVVALASRQLDEAGFATWLRSCGRVPTSP